jgi:hypothetical protein
MTKKYHDPIDAIRDLLNEEYECDSSEEIREDDEESELDWNREVWVKGGGGTWQAKQIRRKVQDTARKIVAMSKEDRFSPSLAYNLYAYCDTLHDFVNGELDEPADAQESTQTPEEAEHELSEFFNSNKKYLKRLTNMIVSAAEGFMDVTYHSVGDNDAKIIFAAGTDTGRLRQLIKMAMRETSQNTSDTLGKPPQTRADFKNISGGEIEVTLSIVK